MEPRGLNVKTHVLVEPHERLLQRIDRASDQMEKATARIAVQIDKASERTEKAASVGTFGLGLAFGLLVAILFHVTRRTNQ